MRVEYSYLIKRIWNIVLRGIAGKTNKVFTILILDIFCGIYF